MFGEFVYNCIKLKVWAEASVTLVFFYSILKNGTSEADAVMSFNPTPDHFNVVQLAVVLRIPKDKASWISLNSFCEPWLLG